MKSRMKSGWLSEIQVKQYKQTCLELDGTCHDSYLDIPIQHAEAARMFGIHVTAKCCRIQEPVYLHPKLWMNYQKLRRNWHWWTLWMQPFRNVTIFREAKYRWMSYRISIPKTVNRISHHLLLNLNKTLLLHQLLHERSYNKLLLCWVPIQTLKITFN